jgi:peptidoglycan hydrolase FlgJ
MTASPIDSKFFADPTALSGLKRDAKAATPEALRETARQFEGLFTNMMLKSMRQATPKDDMFGSDQQDFYQDMFDQQMSVQLSKGKGLGLADMLVKQLMQNNGIDAQDPAVSAAKPASTASATAWPPRDKDEFVRAIQPAATEVARRLGVDPSVVIAHAALETGWGQSVPASADGRPGFNLFGIKAGANWKGATLQSGTQEFEAGRMQNVSAGFRAYDSPEQSMADYANLLQTNPRYAAALGTGGNVEAFAQALQRGGYATDPDYASKLSAVARDLKSRLSRPISAGVA